MECIKKFIEIIESYEKIITIIIALVGVIVAGLAWRAAKKATEEAIRIAKNQEELSLKIQKQSVDLSLFEHRKKVYDHILEWICFADVITQRNIPYRDSLERFYCFVLHKTVFVPLTVKPDYENLKIEDILIRLQTELCTIRMFKILYNSFGDAECSIIDNFTESFINMVLHIDEEMGVHQSAFFYVRTLEEANLAIREAKILGKMQDDIKIF